MIYLQLYLIVLKITLMSFGGAYSIWALIDRELVITCSRSAEIPKPEVQGTEIRPDFRICRGEFNAVFGIGEVLPGPQINAIAILAFSRFGPAGMLVMIASLITPGLVIVSVFGKLQHRLKSSILLRSFFSGAVVSALAVLSVFLMQLVLGLVSKADLRSVIGVLLIGSAFWASFRLRINPFLIVAIAAALGYALLQ